MAHVDSEIVRAGFSRNRRWVIGLACVALLTGCESGPRVIPTGKRQVIDRAIVERPVGLDVTTFIPSLNCPSAIAFDNAETEHKGTIVVAEGAVDGVSPRIIAFKPDGSRQDIYPARRGLLRTLVSGTALRGPIGGLVIHDSEIFVSHRDERGMGVISAFKYDGTRRTVVADLPTLGDYSVTDLAFHPTNGRLFFGIGAATNSGVVGLDNWNAGWPRENGGFSDSPAVKLQLRGLIFDAPNPRGGLFGGDDIARTGPFQRFNAKNLLVISESPTKKPTAAIYSIDPGGGDLQVEAHGMRLPSGLAFDAFSALFVTNQGMELRGSRPVKDDPDSVLRVPGGGTWYGWPDFSADLTPITDPRFQPPDSVVRRSTYSQLLFLIDHERSGLIPPDRATLVRGVFPSLSGANKMTFMAPDMPGFNPAMSGHLVIALSGDRAPYATAGVPLKSPVGYRVVTLDPDTRRVTDLVYNTRLLPASLQGRDARTALERPIDVKFGPDGALYIVDAGRITYRDGRPKPDPGTGRVLRVAPMAR
jgi:glucose/arabinose dehydrogenase